jgi:beta-mannosidase
VYAKGVDWIPADCFLPRVTSEKYNRLLTMAKDAHMNMIRVWGGGIYEDPYFYDKCDELGIMVWQDFMFACGAYPEDSTFLNNVRNEAETVIKTLRNHPSIIIWCGNNENEWIWYRESGKSPSTMPGYSIFHNLLPKLCREMDPTRPYWPTTPWGGKDPNSPSKGNQHSWGIWSNWLDYTQVWDQKDLFITEFGFQAPANLTIWNSYLHPEDLECQNRNFEFHNKQDEGMERLFRFLAAHQKVNTDFDSFIFGCQVNQAEALKTCIEYWRSQKFHTAGTLIWQLNDCWPAISWSLIDSQLSPKASYYYAKDFFHPLLICFSKKADGIYVSMVNDTLKKVTGSLDIKVMLFSGKRLFSLNKNVQVSVNNVTHILGITADRLSDFPHQDCFIRAVFKNDIQESVENCFFFNRFKYLHFPEPEIKVVQFKQEESEVEMTLKTDGFLKSVFIYHPGWEFERNYFNMFPNETNKIRCKSISDSPFSKNKIRIYYVGQKNQSKIVWNN